MIRTLQTYLGKDLAKATGLATVAFTLVMTIFAVLEPLREQGLSGAQALRLFGYSLPLMFSLTLPFAALFATAIVYGRFGQDNELMACRASGICTLTLLKPAIYLGAIVAALTLALALYVAPNLLTFIERTVKHDIEQITYYRLKSRNCVDIPGKRMLFHVDKVDPETGWVEGPVLLDYSDPQNAWCWTAASAQLEFHQRGDRSFVVFHWTDPSLTSQAGGDEWGERARPIKYAELPGLPQGQPKLYDWRKLWNTWHRPEENPVIRQELEKIRREALIGMFHEELIGALESGGSYDKLAELGGIGGPARRKRLELAGPDPRLHRGREVRLGPEDAVATTAPAGADQRQVVVRQFVGDRLDREYFARRARVQGQWREYEDAPRIAVTLEDVDVRLGGLSGSTIHKDVFPLGSYAMPAELLAKIADLQPEEMIKNPQKLAALPQAAERVRGLREETIRRLLAKVHAEVHLRLSYGICCLLMVMLGAALGLLWRGGQVLAAFAVSAMPGTVVILLLFMGRELIRNVGVPRGYGVAVVWGGVCLLAAAVAVIYAGPMRR